MNNFFLSFVKKFKLNPDDHGVWRDDVWGWGEARNGRNLLGKMWMEIRAELMAKEK